MPSQLLCVLPDARAIVIQLQVPCMDVDACEELQMLLDEQLELYRCRPVVLDLSRARFLPSMAIGSLLAARKRLAECGSELTLVGLSENIQRALEVAHLQRGFHIVEDLQQAIAQTGQYPA